MGGGYVPLNLAGWSLCTIGSWKRRVDLHDAYGERIVPVKVAGLDPLSREKKLVLRDQSLIN